MADDYEYRGLVAEAWDLLRGDTSNWGDRRFYRAIIERRGGPALDVGCGTGRLLLDYLAAGLDVDGVDNSPEMLAICRAKAAAARIDVEGRLFEQAMEALALERRYATIFVPSLSFQLLTDPAAAATAMTRFHDQLAPGGALVMSFNAKLWPGDQAPEQMEWSGWQVIAEASGRKMARSSGAGSATVSTTSNSWSMRRTAIRSWSTGARWARSTIHASRPCVGIRRSRRAPAMSARDSRIWRRRSKTISTRRPPKRRGSRSPACGRSPRGGCQK